MGRNVKNIDSCLASAVLAIIYVSATDPALAHHSAVAVRYSIV